MSKEEKKALAEMIRKAQSLNIIDRTAAIEMVLLKLLMEG